MTFQEELTRNLAKFHQRTAIKAADRKMSYAHLLESSNKVTRHLLDQNLEKETIVGIMIADRLDMIVTVIGCLNAGCVIVPIDPNMPEDRLRYLIRDLNLEHLISVSEHFERFSTYTFSGVMHFDLTEIFTLTKSFEVGENHFSEFAENDAIYIYFTSGTTGNPKGIVGRNGSLLQFIKWEIETFELDSVNCSQLINPYFDAFLRDIFISLFTGGTVCVPPDDEDFLTPEKLITWIDQSDVNLIHCVPSVFRIINDASLTADKFESLKWVCLSGERIVPKELGQWYDTFGNRVQLVNFYGTTESTMIRTFYLISPEDVDKEVIPIGSPINETELFISNDGINACGLLESGELYFRSDHLTKGYCNMPDLTQGKFQGHDNQGKTLKTGDLARMMPGERVELIGRRDRQIKLRGVRIELDGLEMAISRNSFIKQVAVCHTEDDLLYAFVILRNKKEYGDDFILKIREWIAQELPDYMRPSETFEVEEFPLLRNGKVDYSALIDLIPSKPIVAPTNAVEEKLLEIWQGVLGQENISIEDNLPAVGGNSIHMMRLIGKIYKELHVKLTLDQLFRNLTIAKQAQLISKSKTDQLYVIPKSEAGNTYHATLAQERIFYQYRLNENDISYNLPMFWEIKREHDIDDIEAKFNLLIDRHENLRTEFHFDNDELIPMIKEKVEFSIDRVQTTEAQLDQLLIDFVRPFDLNKGPLLRCTVFESEIGKKVIGIDFHHIVIDGMSQNIFFLDFLQLLDGGTLKPLHVNFRDYAEWEYQFRKSDIYAGYHDFWLKSFKDEMPKFKLPTVSSKEMDSNKGGTEYFILKHEEIRTLLEFSKDQGITTFSSLYALYFLFISQITGSETVVIGTVTSGRLQEELDNLIGLFVKTIPVYYKVNMDMKVRDFILDVHDVLVKANSNQIYDLTHILNDLNKDRNHSVTNLFETIFVFRNYKEVELLTLKHGFVPYNYDNNTSKFPISLEGTEKDDAFSFGLGFSKAYFTKNDVQLLIQQFNDICHKVSNNLDEKIINVLGESESVDDALEMNLDFNF